MGIAEQFEEEERYDEAYLEYKKQLAHNTDDIDLLTRLAHVSLVLDKTEEAESCFLKIISLDQGNIMAHEQLMSMYEHSDRFKYYVYRGNLNILQQHYTYALNDYKKAVDATQGDEDKIITCRLVMASIYEQLDKPEKAIDEFIQIIDHGATDAYPYIKLAELYQRTDFMSAAIDVLEKAKTKGIADIEELLAGLYIRASLPEKALEITKENLTKIRAYLDLGENEKAFQGLETVSEEEKKLPQYYSLLAQYYFQKEMYDDALETVNEYEKTNYNSPLVFQMRALIHEKKENYFQEHVNWAKYNLVRGEKEVAINEYLDAYQINRSNIQVVEALAFLYEEIGDKNKATEFFECLLELEPNNKTVLEKLARFRDEIGDYQMAIEYMERLKEIDPRNNYVELNLENFKTKLENQGNILYYFRKLFRF